MQTILWILVSVVGAVAWGVLALHRGESINAAWLVLAAVGTYLVGYRFYSRFLAARVLGIDPTRAARRAVKAVSDFVISSLLGCITVAT